MGRLNKIRNFIVDPQYRFSFLATNGYYKWLSDESFLKKAYKIRFGKKLNLSEPKTYSEKLQWLKLYYHDPKYTNLVDKFEVKKYISDCIGEKYIIPTLGVWDKFDDIDFDSLPNQFVLKCTHDSGGIVICKDKVHLDVRKAKKKIEASLKHNFYWQGREWQYKDVRPRIICEKYMEDKETGELRDYKFFSFDGETKALFIATGRQGNDETCFDFFDCQYNHLPFTNGHPNSSVMPQKPDQFEEMIVLANELSKGIPQVRIDFYEVNGQIYFGEMTFFHWSGLKPFEPEEWDYKFGEWIKLPDKKM